jgi:hypothetical protein
MKTSLLRRFAPLALLLLLLTSCSSPGEKNASIYFVVDTPRGLKLVSEIREYSDAEQAIEDLLSGSLQPLDPDYQNLWAGNSSLNGLTIANDLAVVDISLDSLNVGAEGEQRAIDQIVWTLTEINPKIKFVEFLVNSNTIESLAGHVDTTSQFQRQAEYEVLNPLQISSLNQGDAVKSPVTISGEACTFEANVVWTLLKANQPIANNFTTAQAACPERAPWSVELGELEKGEYRIKVEEFSAEDGSLFAFDDKEFTVN